jgi:ATP-dependent Clp protease ATP-binding subunit ClpC
MTSNIGASEIAKNTSIGFTVSEDETGMSYDDMKNRIMGDLKRVFRPEFLNRIDEVIVFHKLAREEVRAIIDLMISRVRAQVAEHELQLELTDEAKDILVDKGWDPAMGARPLRRAIQRYIEDPLADEVLRAGETVSGSTVMVERRPEEELVKEAEQTDDLGRERREAADPLTLKIVKPRKKPVRKKKEPVGVGATGDEPEADGESGSRDGEPQAS